jgi:signal transduction histidine kinase/CheY-like chemotaxis protein/streptogramin lyase
MVSALFEDPQGIIWFGTRRGQIGRVEQNGDHRNGLAVLEPSRPSGFRVTALLQPQPGLLWVGDYGGGIRELHQDSHQIRQISHVPAIGSSLSDNAVTGLMRDRSGLIWVSSLRGVDRYIPSNQHIITVVRQGIGGLPGTDVRSVAATGDGKIWLGFRAEGLALMDPQSNLITAIAPGAKPGNLPAGVIQAVADSGDGQLWAGLTDGLFRIDLASGRGAPYAPLAGANIAALRQDKEGVWVGGSMGLAWIAKDGAPPRIYRFDRADPNSLSNNGVQAVYRDRAQRLWVGTLHGLNLLEDPEKGKFRRFLNSPDAPESLPSDIISGIGEDRFGRIWLATANGIAILDPTRDGEARFRHLDSENGLGSSTVLSVIETGDGGIIAGTGNGLTLIDPQTLEARTFGPAEGVQIQTFWAGAATRMTDGTAVLGGFGGMAVVRPVPSPGWDFIPPLVVTDLRIDGKSRPYSNDIVIAPKQVGFQVDFAALDFSAPERNRYAYRLVGEDKDWIVTDFHHRTAGYTNLAPGTYRLELRGSNSVGLWADPLVLTVRVLPAWYQTLWFRLFAGLAGAIAVMGMMRARRAYYLRRERKLTQEVEAKTSEAEAAKRQALAGEEKARSAMEEAEASAQMKSRFLAIIGHEIRTPLNGLLGMLELLEPAILDGGPREQLSIAKKAGEILRHLVESVLDYGRDSANREQVAPDSVDIRRLISETAALMRPQAQAKDLPLAVTITPDEEIWLRCDQARLARILINLLGNAIKFTERGAINVAVAVVPEGPQARLRITVTDSGIGISPDFIDMIFGEFVQADDSVAQKYGGVGLGLAISRRMAAQMGGSLSVASREGEGSSFCLDLLLETGSALAVPDPAPTGSPLRVLVIDDDAINQTVAKHLLLHLGHCPTILSSGGQAIGSLAAGEFDVVLMDLRMPDMDGMQATRRIRQWESGRHKRIRILAMSADLTPEILQQCERAGMDGGISKPVQLEKLRRILDRNELPELPLLLRHELVDGDFLTLQLDILGAPEMIRLARLFHRTSRQLLGAMEAAAQAGDRAALEGQAHRLRSAAGSLCLSAVSSKAAHIQAEASLAPLSELVEQIGLLRQALRAGLKALGQQARIIAAQSRATPKR